MKVTAKLKQGYYFLDHPVRRRGQRTQLQYVTCKQNTKRIARLRVRSILWVHFRRQVLLCKTGLLIERYNKLTA